MVEQVIEPVRSPDADRGRATIGKVARRLLPFMFLVYVANYLDRVNVSFAANSMNPDVGLSNTAYGFGAGIFFFGYVLFQVPANLILVRIGARRWIGSIVIAWGLVAGLFSVIHTPAEFYVLRVLLGFAEAGFFPGMLLYLTYWFPAAERAKAVSRFMLAIPVSGVIGGPLAGALLQMHGIAGVAGWRWLFLIEAIPSVVLGIAALWYLTDRPAAAAWLEPVERDWLEGVLAREAAEARERCDQSPVRVLANGTVWWFAAIWIMTNLPGYGLVLWLPQLIREHSALSDVSVGVLAAIPYFVACFAMILVGRSSDRRGERVLHAAVPLFVSTAGMMLAGVSTSVPVTVTGLSLALAGNFAYFGPFWSIPPKFLHGAGAAAAIALINAVGNIGGFVGPYALGALKDQTQSFRGSLLALAGMMCCAAVATTLLKLSRRLGDAR